jgi:gamma-glutamyltranspeptidase / glutathione hydrolase
VPEHGPLAAVTPGTPGGIIAMVAEYGRLSLAQVLAPAIRMADGYPIEAQTADAIERNKDRLKEWPYSRAVMLPHLGEEREAPHAGEIFRQPDLAATLRKLVEAEEQALAARRQPQGGHLRRPRALLPGRHRRGAGPERPGAGRPHHHGGPGRLERPVRGAVSTTYKGIEVYKLTHWTQGPVMLQALNILENFDLQAMGYNSARYVHALYQAMNLAFADRDFYYGDPDHEPAHAHPRAPVQGVRPRPGRHHRLGAERPGRPAR